MSETPVFNHKEIRYMQMAHYGVTHGQSDLTAYTTVVKLMSLAGIEVNAGFEDTIDRAFRLAQDRRKDLDDRADPGTDYGTPAEVGEDNAP